MRIDLAGAVLALSFPILEEKLDSITAKLGRIMSAIDDLNKSEAAEKADIATLSGLTKQLLTAFANQSMTPAQAQALLDNLNSDDAAVKGNIASIQAALTPTPQVGP